MFSGECVKTHARSVRLETRLQLLSFVGDTPVCSSAVLISRHWRFVLCRIIVTRFVAVTTGTCSSVTATPHAIAAELLLSVCA